MAIMAMDNTTTTDIILLRPGLELKCPHCPRWHEVFENEFATGSAAGQLFWMCRRRRFFAGNIGGGSRFPIRNRRGQ